MLYHIFVCPSCSMKAEISVKGEVLCPCGVEMEKVGEMRAR